MKTIGLWMLGKKDAVKALIMAIIGSVTSLIGDAVVQAINTGDYSFSSIHWKYVGSIVAGIVLTYIQKQLGTNSEGKFLKAEPIPPTDAPVK